MESVSGDWIPRARKLEEMIDVLEREEGELGKLYSDTLGSVYTPASFFISFCSCMVVLFVRKASQFWILSVAIGVIFCYVVGVILPVLFAYRQFCGLKFVCKKLIERREKLLDGCSSLLEEYIQMCVSAGTGESDDLLNVSTFPIDKLEEFKRSPSVPKFRKRNNKKTVILIGVCCSIFFVMVLSYAYFMASSEASSSSPAIPPITLRGPTELATRVAIKSLHRYALDVNVERAEDVLTHKKLLLETHDRAKRPVFDVRLVQVPPASNGHMDDLIDSSSSRNEVVQSIHAPPAFGSPNIESLAIETKTTIVQDDDSATNASAKLSRPMHEITFSADDKPKLLSQLTSLLAEIGLNIQEAHAFSTVDGYSFDVFVVDGWPFEETEQLRTTLAKEDLKIESRSWPNQLPLDPLDANEQSPIKSEHDHLTIPSDGTDIWEIDPQLKFGCKFASVSYCDLYKGTYGGREVAIKIFMVERVNAEMQWEFAQEVYIMRKVRHKNVVQFIGACTKPPSLCIVTEYMSGGSVYDYLHKHKGTFKLPSLLKVAIDISKGMNSLHQNNIVHRDLKAANLLMDENEVVKVAGFGVARVKSQSGVMTAETGTYRWMAPEVIEHKPYDHKADIFSFATVLWELLTGKIPYQYLTPLQAAVGVVQKGLSLTIPKNTLPKLAELLERCWQQDPTLRPDFTEIIAVLQQIAKEVGDDGDDHRRSGGFLSVRRGHH